MRVFELRSIEIERGSPLADGERFATQGVRRWPLGQWYEWCGWYVGASMGEPLGLIAGAGHLPGEMARAAKLRGREPVVVALRGAADAELLAAQDPCWLPIGQVEALLEHFRSRGVREAVMGGKVPKSVLFAGAADRAVLDLDDRAIALLAALPDRADDSILRAIADTLADEGVRLAAQADWVPELVPGRGSQGAVEPSEQQLSDLRFGWPIAKAIAGLDVGQSLVVQQRAVIAVEAIEGTDAAIRRAGEVGNVGGVVIKVAKPNQDPRFDMPAIGAGTIEAMQQAGARMLAYEAGATFLLERERVVDAANAAGIALFGVPTAGPE